MPKYQPTPLANAHCATGENPLWHAEQNCVYWTDIPNGRLFRYFLDDGRWEQFYSGPQVGGFTFQTDGNLLLFRETDIVKLGPDGSESVVAQDIDPVMERFNDITADPEGRIYAGTCADSVEKGGVYRVDLDGAVTHLFYGTSCSNGMGFSPDLKHYYWTDSSAAVIYRFDYDRTSGQIGNRSVFFAEDAAKNGTPDGMAVDAEGCVWSARWDGYSLVRHAPTGEKLEQINFPVAKVSSVAFGGSDLRDIYVTTAGGEDGADTQDGTLYHVRVDVPGMGENRSRICL